MGWKVEVERRVDGMGELAVVVGGIGRRDNGRKGRGKAAHTWTTGLSHWDFPTLHCVYVPGNSVCKDRVSMGKLKSKPQG